MNRVFPLPLRLFAVCFLLFSLTATASEETLRKLDDAIRNRRQYEIPKREAIIKARTDYEKAHDDQSRYEVLRSLYKDYRSYRVDSALIVAHQRLEIARRLGQPSKIASASINLAEGYVRSGAVSTAINILDTLDSSALEPYHLKYRNGVYREAYRSKIANAVLKEEKDEAQLKLKALTDSALKDSPSNSRGYFTLTAEKLCDAGLYTEAVATIEEAARRFDFSSDAGMLAKMGDIYCKAGDKEKGIESLASSALLDISSGTKEYRSLISLAGLLFETGDISRAFEYINCAFEDAEFSHANLRTAEIMKTMPIIDRSFHETETKVARRTQFFLIAAGLLVVALLILLGWYVKALRSNRRIMAINEKVKARLADKNSELAEANSLKLHYVTILMKAYSGYISRWKNSRKNVYRCLKANQYDKALELVKTNRYESGDLTEFQSIFDEAFLAMFPDFIEKVNACMKDKIELKEPSRLTPELRVIALMKLRMGSTEEISEIFHYSSQTVYNLRTSIRGMLNIPWEEFEKHLQEM